MFSISSLSAGLTNISAHESLAPANLIPKCLGERVASDVADVMDADVELVALVDEGVEGAAGLVVLLQHEHPLARLGQDGRRDEAAGAAAHDDGVEVGRNLTNAFSTPA